MNGKHYIGKKVSHIEKYDETAPISGVALLLDENNQILAGDQNGFVLDIECPYGTQAMANDILAKVRGHTYKGFRADNAPLAIDAELGDGVTVDGLYSVLAYRSVKFGPGHFSEIAAPGENELRHEYNYLTPNEKLSRKIAGTNSRITKTAEQIRLEVSNEFAGLGTSIDIKLGGITSRVENAEESISTLTQTVDGLNFQVNNKEGKFSKLSIDVAGIQTTIGDKNSGLISEINQKVSSISLSVSELDNNKKASIVLNVDGEKQTGQINLSGLVSFTNLASSGQTIINGGNITTGTMSANRISGGTLTLGGANNGSGKAEIKDTLGKTLITLDNKGITLDSSVYIAYSNISNTPNIAQIAKETIPDSHITQITKNTVTTSYINALDITAQNVNCQRKIYKDGYLDTVYEANMNSSYTIYKYLGYLSNGTLSEDYEIGRIGLETWKSAPSNRGITFGLSNSGAYMGWGVQSYPGGTYVQKLAYWRAGKYIEPNLKVESDSLNVFCKLDLHNYGILNGGFENGATGTVSLNDGTVLTFESGVLIDIY